MDGIFEWCLTSFVGVLILFLIIMFFVGIRIVRPTQKGLIERLGKYKKTADQGFHWIIPIIDKMIKVNITENMVGQNPASAMQDQKPGLIPVGGRSLGNEALGQIVIIVGKVVQGDQCFPT